MKTEYKTYNTKECEELLLHDLGRNIPLGNLDVFFTERHCYVRKNSNMWIITQQDCLVGFVGLSFAMKILLLIDKKIDFDFNDEEYNELYSLELYGLL